MEKGLGSLGPTFLALPALNVPGGGSGRCEAGHRERLQREAGSAVVLPAGKAKAALGGSILVERQLSSFPASLAIIHAEGPCLDEGKQG